MDEVLALSLQSLQTDMSRLDQVGMNLANVLTPGYKRSFTVQSLAGSSFADHLANAGVSVRRVQPESPVHLAADMRPGTLKPTGQALDVAIVGRGYFEVLTDSGLAYTRDGSFHLDDRGRLVTSQGYAVMGTAGEIVTGSAPISIASNGVISSASGGTIAKLKLLDFEPGVEPQRVGHGLVAFAREMKQVAGSEISVRQGFLENSNATSTLEMGDLVQAMRHFEGMQKVLQGYDEMLGSTIRKLTDNS